jgi:hypothetical protein
MRGIINNIINFYEMQAKVLGVLVANTQKALEQSENQRKADELIQKVENFVRDLIMNLNNMLTRFYFLKDRNKRQHKEMTQTRVKALANFTNFVKTLTGNVSSLLKRSLKSHTFEEKIDMEIMELEACIGHKLKEEDSQAGIPNLCDGEFENLFNGLSIDSDNSNKESSECLMKVKK